MTLSLRSLLRRVPITRRSTAAGCVRVVPAHGATHIEHALHVPRGACPVSGNPLSGTLTIAYAPRAHAIEVVSLHDALAWACSRQPGAPRSVEELAMWAAREAAQAVGVPVVATLRLVVRPGRQSLAVSAEAQP